MELPLFDEFVTKSNKLQNQLKVFSSFFNVFPSRRLLEGDLPRLWILPRHIQADCRLRSQYKRLTLMIWIIIMMPIIKMIIFTMTVVHIQGLWWSSTFPRVQHWLGNLPHTNLGQATVCRRPPENFRQVLHSFDETCSSLQSSWWRPQRTHRLLYVPASVSEGGVEKEGLLHFHHCLSLHYPQFFFFVHSLFDQILILIIMMIMSYMIITAMPWETGKGSQVFHLEKEHNKEFKRSRLALKKKVYNSCTWSIPSIMMPTIR